MKIVNIGRDWTITLKKEPGVRYINREDEEALADLIKQWVVVLNRAGVSARKADRYMEVVGHWAQGFRDYMSEDSLMILDEFLSWIHFENIYIVAFEVY